jgi:hypothetical protein
MTFSLTLVVLLIESEWDLITPKPQLVWVVENNSTCYLREEYEMIKHCEPCNKFEIKLAQTNKHGVCFHTQNKEVLKCQSGEIVIKSCDKVAFVERKNFFTFMIFSFIISIFATSVINLRQKFLDRNFFKTST